MKRYSLALAFIASGCNVTPPQGSEASKPPLLAGEGVLLTTSGSSRYVSVDTARVPLVDGCVEGQLLQYTASGWACVAPDYLSSTTCGDGDVLVKNGSAWACTKVEGLVAAVAGQKPEVSWTDYQSLTVSAGTVVAGSQILHNDAVSNWSFVNGTGLGGLDTGTAVDDKWYYLYAVPDGTGGFDTVASRNPPVGFGGDGPSGYLVHRYLASFYETSSGITEFVRRGNVTQWRTRRQKQSSPITSYTAQTLLEVDLSSIVPATALRTKIRGWFMSPQWDSNFISFALNNSTAYAIDSNFSYDLVLPPFPAERKFWYSNSSGFTGNNTTIYLTVQVDDYDE